MSKRDRLSDAEIVLIARAVGNHIQYGAPLGVISGVRILRTQTTRSTPPKSKDPIPPLTRPAKIFAIAAAWSFSKSRRAGSRPAKRSSSSSKYQSDMIIRRLAAPTYKTRGALNFEMTLWSPSLRAHKTSELPMKYLLVGTVVVITTTALLRHCLGLYGWRLARARRRTNPRSVSQRDRRALGSTFSNYTSPSSSASRPDPFSGMLTNEAHALHSPSRPLVGLSAIRPFSRLPGARVGGPFLTRRRNSARAKQLYFYESENPLIQTSRPI